MTTVRERAQNPYVIRAFERRMIRLPSQVESVARQNIAEVVEYIGHMLNSRSFSRENQLSYFQKLVDANSVMFFGERGLNAVNWAKPPRLGVAERRYLVVMDRIADSVEEGDYTTTRQILKGLTSFDGERGHSGGPPCSPELLTAFIPLRVGLDEALEEGKISNEPEVSEGLALSIRDIAEAYRLRDRQHLAESLFNLYWVIDFETRPRPQSPNLGGFIKRGLGSIRSRF